MTGYDVVVSISYDKEMTLKRCRFYICFAIFDT